MKTLIAFRRIPKDDLIYDYIGYLFNYVQWMAVTTVIIYAGQKTGSIYIKYFGVVLENILFFYATRIVFSRIEIRISNGISDNWIRKTLQIFVASAIGIGVGYALTRGWWQVFSDLLKYQSCS